MKKIFFICLNDCKLIVRERLFIFWALILPLLFAFVFVKAFSGSGQPARAYLAVRNLDKGPWGTYFIAKLQRPDMDIDVVGAEPANASKWLVIPADFSKKIAGVSPQALLLKSRSGANQEALVRTEVALFQAIVQVLAEIVLHPDAATFFLQHQEFRNLVQLKSGFPPAAPAAVPSGFDHQIPGTLVNFLLMNAMIAGGITLMIDRRKRLLERMLYSPLTSAQLWLGKFAGRLLTSLLQAAVLLAAGVLLFHFRLGHLGLAALLVVAFSLAVTALSLFFGAVLKREEMIIGLSILTANVLSALGGCWWPIEIVGRPFRMAGMLFPTYWAMDGFHKIIFFHQGLASLILPLSILLAYTLLFSLLSFRFLNIRD